MLFWWLRGGFVCVCECVYVWYGVGRCGTNNCYEIGSGFLDRITEQDIRKTKGGGISESVF